jgi:alanine racemase
VTIRLTVRSAIWRSQVAQTVNSVDGLVPVIKGNGYGFGRLRLAEMAAEFCDTVAVGTVHELGGLPSGLTATVLTPVLVASLANDEVSGLIAQHDPILTVSSGAHVEALAVAGWSGRVIVKVATDMKRYGVDAAKCPMLVAHARANDLDVVGVALHPPLAGTSGERAAQIIAALPSVDSNVPVWTSHLDAATYGQLPTSHSYRLRLGTSLWHGDKSALHLSADVIEVRRIAAGETAGYRLAVVPGDGHLVMIGAGTANGVAPLPDGRSPFHFERARLALHESPHMHTSMAFVPAGDALPDIGDRVDLQRALHATTVDEYEWL